MTEDALWEKFIATPHGPMEVVDFAGIKHVFELSGYKTAGYALIAKESSDDPNGGYEFSAFSYASPYEALAQLSMKIGAELATRHLDPHHFPHLLAHSCRGRVAYGGVVIDGKFLSWEHFSDMVQPFEGWELSLKFNDD